MADVDNSFEVSWLKVFGTPAEECSKQRCELRADFYGRWERAYIALDTSLRRIVISMRVDMLPNFDVLNSGRSFGSSASTSVGAIDAGRPCRTLTRL